jgi:ParB-like chromosome segregation protein Spo0J
MIEIKEVLIEKLKAAEYNPRQISEKEFANLRKSIREFDVVQLIVVRKEDNEIIGGHQTVRAAKDG